MSFLRQQLKNNKIAFHLQQQYHYYHTLPLNPRTATILVASSGRSYFSTANNSTRVQQQQQHEQEEETTPLQQHQQQQQQRPIYVAATRQHVGKTSVSLALVSGLQKRCNVGFMKPVGQISLHCQETDGTTVQVDKDVALVKQHFRLQHLRYKHMSPVLIPPGYTRNYVQGNVAPENHRDIVQQAYGHIAAQSDVVLCEGTGHCAVGSVVHASNAECASWIDAKMVLVANGGLGNSFDELTLNYNFCQQHQVEVAGVIINKVLPEKYEQTKYYLGKLLHERWGVPLLGIIPDRPFLGCPALSDLERLFKGAVLVSGHEQRLRHYRVQDLNLVTTSLEVFLKSIRKSNERTLYVCHSSRNDIILGFLMEAQQRDSWESAIVVTGCDEHPISDQVLEIITSTPNAPPVLLTQDPSRKVMEDIHHYTPKLNYEDEHRVNVTVQHYEPYIDFDLLLERMNAKLVTRATA